MSNKSVGSKFENFVAETLSKYNIWVHLLTGNASGQPGDLIMVKHDTAYLVDCKVCKNNRFTLSRIEENQILANEHWERCGNLDYMYFIAFNYDGGRELTEDDIVIVPLKILLDIRNSGEKSVTKEWCVRYGKSGFGRKLTISELF